MEKELIGDVKAELSFRDIQYAEIIERVLGKENPVLAEHDWSAGTLIVLAPIREANPYHRIDSLEKNDMVTAAFLDVIMVGLKKENLKVQENSLRRMITEILSKWSILLEEKHILIQPFQEETEGIEDNLPIALVGMYIILNNFILNSAWFLEQEHNCNREILFRLKEETDGLHLFMENNGPVLAEKYRDNPDKIFELGETSKEGKGTGLGLWVVKETVERNDGTISVMEKQEGFGLEIVWKKRRQ